LFGPSQFLQKQFNIVNHIPYLVTADIEQFEVKSGQLSELKFPVAKDEDSS
jgi:hypothetical protein